MRGYWTATAPHRGINHMEGALLPSRVAVEEMVVTILNVLFPGYYEKQELRLSDVSLFVWERVVSIYHGLSNEIAKSLAHTRQTWRAGPIRTYRGWPSTRS